MKILRYEELELSEDFIKILSNSKIIESNLIENSFTIKLNALNKITEFKAFNSLVNIVEALIAEGNIQITVNKSNIELFLVAAIAVCINEENNYVFFNCNKLNFESEIKNVLEELKLRGIGNGLVKMLSDVIKSIFNLYKIVYNKKTNTIIDIFNNNIVFFDSIAILIKKYHFNMNNIIDNFNSISLGISTMIKKYGLDYIFKKSDSKLLITERI